MTRTRLPRLPLAPALAFLPSEPEEATGALTGHARRLSRATGWDLRRAYRYVGEGALPEHAADELAAALGLHPANIWTGWPG